MFILDYLNIDFFFQNLQGTNSLCLLCLYIIIFIFTLTKISQNKFSTKKIIININKILFINCILELFLLLLFQKKVTKTCMYLSRSNQREKMCVLTTNRKLKEVIRFNVMLYFNNFSNLRYLWSYFFISKLLIHSSFLFLKILFILSLFFSIQLDWGFQVFRKNCMKKVTFIVEVNLFEEACEK